MTLKRNVWMFDDYDDGAWELTWDLCGRRIRRRRRK